MENPLLKVLMDVSCSTCFDERLLEPKVPVGNLAKHFSNFGIGYRRFGFKQPQLNGAINRKNSSRSLLPKPGKYERKVITLRKPSWSEREI